MKSSVVRIRLCYLLLPCLLASVAAQDFQYDRQEDWAGACRSGLKQSPIGLYRETAVEKDFTPLRFTGYDEPQGALIQNSGHTVRIRLVNTIRPTLEGGGLVEHYTFDHLHFHWDSEHTLEDFRFPLELHMVHFATAHGSFENATRYLDGVSVLAVLFDESPDDDNKMNRLVEPIRQVQGLPTEEKPMEDFILSDYLPRDTAGFYRYDGSLTTPECNEVVVWTVFTNTLHVSREQITMFKSFKNHKDELIMNNYRDLRSRDDRIVFRKVSPMHHDGAMTLSCHNVLLLIIPLAVSMLQFFH